VGFHGEQHDEREHAIDLEAGAQVLKERSLALLQEQKTGS